MTASTTGPMNTCSVRSVETIRLRYRWSDVARLEEIPHVSIQRSTGQPVIPYRRRIMPLLSLDRTGQVTPRPHGGVPVVVHNVGPRCVGLMVEQIVDIATADGTAGHQSTTDGHSRPHLDRRTGGGRGRYTRTGSGMRRPTGRDHGGQAMKRVRQYSTFFVEQLHFGVPVELVQEAILPVPTTAVPLTTDVVVGLINLRGQIVMALDMRARIGLPPRGTASPSVSLILRTTDGLVSLQVDRLGDVLDLEAVTVRGVESPSP